MNVPMKLLTIKNIFKTMNYYKIRFINGYSLMVTYLHSFRVERENHTCNLSTNELISGYKIWVDIHAFGIDKSYIRTNKR